jgi:hypothetical protein
MLPLTKAAIPAVLFMSGLMPAWVTQKQARTKYFSIGSNLFLILIWKHDTDQLDVSEIHRYVM